MGLINRMKRVNHSAIYQHLVNNRSAIYKCGVINCKGKTRKKLSCRHNKYVIISKLAHRGTWYLNLKLIYTLSAYGSEQTHQSFVLVL